MRTTALTLALLAGIGGTAAAKDVTPLFAQGYWAVNHVAYEDGVQVCELVSTSTDGTSQLIFYGNSNGGDGFMITNRDWNLAHRTVKGEVWVDRAGFEFEGEGRASFVNLPFPGDEFVEAFLAGREMRVTNSEGQALYTTSLSGSTAAFYQLVDCYGKIAPNSSDPFTAASSDPF